jgi:hypothetical protein
MPSDYIDIVSKINKLENELLSVKGLEFSDSVMAFYEAKNSLVKLENSFARSKTPFRDASFSALLPWVNFIDQKIFWNFVLLAMPKLLFPRNIISETSAYSFHVVELSFT